MTSPNLVLLVPPSEGKAAGGAGRFRPPSGAFGRRLGPLRAAVAEAVAVAVTGRDETAAMRILGVRGDLLARAQQASADVAAGRAKSLPAWQRFTGVVWEHLDPASLDGGDDARRRLLVPSGLLGLVAGTDPVPDHRLKLSVSVPGIGRLDRHWRPAVTLALAGHRRDAVLVDLLPNEHAAAVDFDRLRARRRVVRVRFVAGEVESQAVAVGHFAKAAKGRLARALLVGGLEAAHGWQWEGWQARSVTTDGSDDAIVVTAP